MQNAVVTVDGPVASGKTVLCQRLVQRLNQWDWLSTGVFYRGLAYMILELGLKDSEKKWPQMISEEKWKVEKEKHQTSFWYEGENKTPLIYNASIDQMASRVAENIPVRQALISCQRAHKKEGRGLIAEGRDCGTAIFPQAPLKLYLTAQDEVRAQRRAKDRNELPDRVISAQRKRDYSDSQRAFNPLRKPEGAWIIHTDQYSLDEMEEMVYKKVKSLF
ncbi:MAG: (d)CMP kinase [Bdellovibrionales bacterium]|nr:(d)CMP kinase [Bdellovibrionales bacterium]